MSQDDPQTLADALDRKAQHLREILNRGLDLTAKLRQLATDLRAEDVELGELKDALCDWHADKQRTLKV